MGGGGQPVRAPPQGISIPQRQGQVSALCQVSVLVRGNGYWGQVPLPGLAREIQNKLRKILCSGKPLSDEYGSAAGWRMDGKG